MLLIFSAALYFATRSKGNLVNEMDNRNPTALLVSAIEKSAVSGNVAKEDEFYLGVLRDGDLWFNESYSEAPRAERWRLKLRRLPGKAHSFRSVYLHPLASHSRISHPLSISYSNAQMTPLLQHATKNSFTFVAVPQFESVLAGQEEDTATVVHDTIALT